MDRDEALREGLRRSNARFQASMNRILKHYNHPFEDDVLVSMDTLTYDTAKGPKRWERLLRNSDKKWRKKVFKYNTRSRAKREISEDHCSGPEDEVPGVHQESSENNGGDMSDSGEERVEIVPVRRKSKGTQRQVTTPRSSKNHHSTPTVEEEFEISEDHCSGPEDEVPGVHQESSENNGGDMSDSGEERVEIVPVRRKSKGTQRQNPNVDNGQRQKKRVPVDVIVQGDDRNIPKWIKVTTPRSSKNHHSTPTVEEEFEISEDHCSGPEDEVPGVHQESSENNGGDMSDSGEERVEIVPVRRKSKGTQRQNPNVDNGQRQKKRVPVDVIVQGDDRNIPKWIKVTTPRSSKDLCSSPAVEEEFGNQAAVCRKKLELSNEHSSCKHLQIQCSGVPIPSNTIALPRQQPCPGQSTTLCGSVHEEYQPADEGCSWSNTTLADLYPAMLELFTKFMAKHSQRKTLKHTFGHLRSRRWHSRRPKHVVTVDKVGGSRACKPKTAFHSICSCSSEDNQNPAFGNESKEFCCDSGLISSSSDLAPYAYTDTNEMGDSDSDLEEHLACGKGQEVCKPTDFPDVMNRMGETFLVERELQATASPENSLYIESEKLAYKHFSEPSFIISTACSDSRALPLVKERKSQKTDFCVGASQLCPCICSSHGNNRNSTPITNCSPARSSNSVFVNPEKIVPERQTSFQHKDSFFSCFMKQSPSNMQKKYEDAFEELYHKVCSEEYQKSLTLTRPLLNSQNLEEKGRLVKSNLSVSGRSIQQCDLEFDGLHEKLCVPGNRRESVPKFPEFQTVSNCRNYEEVQMPETVNAYVNSPIQSSSAIFRVKRTGNSENYLPCSPLKRLKLTPERCISSRKCQEISHSKKGSPQTADMDVLCMYNCSSLSFLADHNSHCQGSGSHDSSGRGPLGIPGTSLQEPRTAGVHSGCPGAVGNCSSPGNLRKRHSRVNRKLSYTDEKDQL